MKRISVDSLQVDPYAGEALDVEGYTDSNS